MIESEHELCGDPIELSRMEEMSMFPRKINLIICAMLILMALSAACAPAAQPAVPEGAKSKQEGATGKAVLEEPGQRGGKMNMGGALTLFGNPNDPHLVITASGRVSAMPVANTLLKRDIYDPGNAIVPDLAEKWEVSKDGLSYTFKLRQGVKFQNVPPVNGRDLTSEDARFNLLRIVADPSIVPEKARPRFQRKTDFGSIKSIEAPDKYTVVVNLAEPYAPFLDAISHPGTVILPKDFVQKFEGGLILEGMIGTGPYIQTEYKNQVIVSYKRNPDYWRKDSKGNQLPYLDEVSYVAFSDLQAELASFRSRQLDTTASNTAVTKGMMDSIKQGDPNVKVLVSPRANFVQYRFNMKFKPFQDVRVRRAIHLALDRQQFVDLMTEGTGVIVGPVTTPIYKDVANSVDWLLSQPGYRKDKKQDIEEAKRLLKEAGYAEGLTVNVLYTSSSTAGDHAAVLVDQLKAINVTAKPELVDYAGQWIPRSVNGEFELSFMGHTVNTDVDSMLSPHLHTEGGRNYGKFSDPKLDQLIEKQRSTVNPEERRKWAQETEKYIFETIPIAYLYGASQVKFVQPWAHNIADSPIPGGEYGSVEMAWVDKR